MENILFNYLKTIILLQSKGIKFGKLPYIKGQMPILTNKGNFRIGNNFKMTNDQLKSQITCSDDAELIIGDDVFINQGSNIYAAKSVNIGNNVLIADSVVIHDTNFHSVLDDDEIVKPVKIDNSVWIGFRSIILPGVTIGKNSVIGAGSVVTRSVPSNHLAAGSPAKIIKKLNSSDFSERKCIC